MFLYMFTYSQNCIMDSHNKEENNMETNNNKDATTQPKISNYEVSWVLETMRHLIVKIQVFKIENEQLKKAQEKHQDINDILLCNLHDRI